MVLVSYYLVWVKVVLKAVVLVDAHGEMNQLPRVVKVAVELE